ncbi:family 43 glycosylhydrolase [Aestuariibaculum sp. YM273]|uniref:family 43 glycosylhydrolase n=1 Tax=Aestuariibaculum sp. YM273 TaxID=3070659 RepID=UPI0027DAF355|nr:family 43 glycosylhydrolase [Aestuariibaculum sp. YM273]WMI65222.1 family 43 glycosylhydrolase [Aestuariibaculum sp. YM273]
MLLVLFVVSCNKKNSGKNIVLGSTTISNPVLPGYYADPTIKKFGDIYYIYATTDNEMLASGAPTVWYSNDLQNWYNYTMEIPSLESVNLRNFWAPDIVEGKDGKYYLYFGNCQAGCNIYGYVSETPVGPWTKLNEDDTPVIAHNYPRPGFPSLDAQFFTDTDGKVYAYWGTWVHYNGGYAVGELDTNTMKDIINPENIPLEQTPNPFEAVYMMKKGDKYILMYSGESCHDETYKVLYSYSNSPYGPFTPGENNPILSSNEDLTVHGPGHHSVLEDGEDTYIVYHKHDYPMTRGGLSRQVCIDRMIFENDSTIKTVVPSLKGILPILQSKVPENIAHNAKTMASSSYHLQSLDYDYVYESDFATDDNNATMWKAENNTSPQSLTIDLGETKDVKRVATQFEFASYYYQYIIEYSKDGMAWEMYADKAKNYTSGSPMIDDNDVEARYIKLTILATEKAGLLPAVWNIKVYSELFEIPLQLKNKPSTTLPASKSAYEKIIDITAESVVQETLTSVKNMGTLSGVFSKQGNVGVIIDKETGKKAFEFTKGALILDKEVPENLSWNGSFTVATWVKNPEISNQGEILASWCNRFKYGLANSYNALAYNSGPYGAAAHLDGHFDMAYKNLPTENQWHYIVLTFDGVVEKIYVDGVLDNSQNMLLSSAIENAKFIVGSSDIGEHFSGLMTSFEMYDYAIDEEEILKQFKSRQY